MPPSKFVQVAFVFFKFESIALPFQEIQIHGAWPPMARGPRWCVALDGVWLPMARGPRRRVAPEILFESILFDLWIFIFEFVQEVRSPPRQVHRQSKSCQT